MTPSAPPTLFEHLVGEFYSRRLLLLSPLDHSTAPAPSNGHATSSSSEPYGDNSFDSNVVMVLSVLLCALICSLGLNSIIRCALRCSSFVHSDSSGGAARAASTRLANTGVKRKALKTFPVVSYSTDFNLPGLDSECVICLSEFTLGERIRLLPKCNHGFHVRCIDKWLSSHSSCPTCRHCLFETCQKIVASYSASSQVGTSSAPPSPPPPPPPPPPSVHLISIPPLEPEGFVRNYRGIN